MTRKVVTVEKLNIDIKGRGLLREVSFELPATGMTALMGPIGVGKSTLIKWLCGQSDPSIVKCNVERAMYQDKPLSQWHSPELYPQLHTRSFDETMQLLGDRLQRNPALLCVDEVTARLSDENTKLVLERLAAIARSRALLVVSHNQEHMQKYADSVMLLAAGRLQEVTPAAEFFEKPRSVAGRQFLGTGSVELQSMDTPQNYLRSDLRELPTAFRQATEEDASGLRPIVDDELYLLSKKKGTWPTERDLKHLCRSGVTTVVLFGLPDPTMNRRLENAGLSGLWSAHLEPDVSVPAAMNWCTALQARIDAGESLAFLRRGGDTSAAHAISYQLVKMSVPAATASAVCANILGVHEISPVEEQFLWDLELAMDLESEGLSLEKDNPDIPWIEAQTARRRETRKSKHSKQLSA